MSYSNRRIALALALALALPLVTASPALADEVAAHVNRARSESLALAPAAERLAAASATAQASAGSLFHADLSGLLGECDSVGEVVGTAPAVAGVFAAFRQSSNHWSIITDPTWTAMGTGLATGPDGMVYVAVVFCRQTDTAAQTPSPPVTTGPSLVAPTPPAPHKAAEVPFLVGELPPIADRLGKIRAMLDPQAGSQLPDRYVGAPSPSGVRNLRIEQQTDARTGLHQQFGDLDGVKGGAFPKVIADRP